MSGWLGGLVRGRTTATILNCGFKHYYPFLTYIPSFFQFGPKLAELVFGVGLTTLVNLDPGFLLNSLFLISSPSFIQIEQKLAKRFG